MARYDIDSSSGYYNNPVDFHQSWGWFAALGALLIILGLIALSASMFFTVISAALLGVLIFLGGLVNLVHAFQVRRWSGFFGSLITGLLLLVVGWLIMTKPVMTAMIITLIMAAYFITTGLFRTIFAAVTRFQNWGWFMLSGFISLFLGLLIWAQWPISGLYIIGLFFGIDMLLLGFAWLTLGFQLRQTPSRMA